MNPAPMVDADQPPLVPQRPGHEVRVIGSGDGPIDFAQLLRRPRKEAAWRC